MIGGDIVKIEKITNELVKNIGSDLPLIREAGFYILLGDGKLLRPILFILCCKLCGYEKEDIYSISTVFEYIHVASLLHDDVLDNAETRRNKPSVNNKWGNHVAILEGDFLYTRSIITALKAKNLKFMEKIAEATSDMVEGQIMEIAYSNKLDLTKEEYMKIVEKKTASLLSAACASGAIIAGAGKRAEEALSRFGFYLGIAFQLIDDLLDYIAKEERFGKPVGKDIREGKITLPLIYALEEMKEEEREKIERILKEKAPSCLYEEIIEKVRKTNAIRYTKEEALCFVEKAKKELSFFEDSPIKESLICLSNYIINRDR